MAISVEEVPFPGWHVLNGRDSWELLAIKTDLGEKLEEVCTKQKGSP